MTFPRRYVVAAALLLIPILGAATVNSKSSRAESSSNRMTLVPIRSAVARAVTSGLAKPGASLSPSMPLTVNLGLPLRNMSRLNWFISHKADRGVYLSKGEFDRQFGPTPQHLAAVISWAHQRKLDVAYVSRDRQIVTLTGTVGRFDSAMHVHIRRYTVQGAVDYATGRAPLIPRYLNIQTITGLDDIRKAVAMAASSGSGRRGAIPDGGLTPQAIRTAYDMNQDTVAGSTVDGAGQTVAITGFGETVPNSDFKLFDENVAGPLACAPQFGSCPKNSDKVVWYQIGGVVKNDSDIDEQALDVEYLNALAPHAQIDYYLGQDGADWAMEKSIDDAASNPSVHVVSNSWGDPGKESASASNSFVVATQNYLKKAVATGTTFYFSTGDNAADSGCAGPQGQVTPCGRPTYPADSPYVVAVGATNLQLNSSLTSWSSETTWNLTSGDWGSGGGCAPFFSRPAWQTGIGAVSCKGRAIPDVSAAGDAENSPIVAWDHGSPIEVGGTSVAATLISGMAVDTNSFLTLQHAVNPAVPERSPTTSAKCTKPSEPSGFCWMGWTAPEIYRLAHSSLYSADFHDVLCGSNTWAARTGWDEATGWGSFDWLNYSRSVAGLPVTPASPSASWTCTPGGPTTNTLTAVACNPVYHCRLGGTGGVLYYSSDAWHWHSPAPGNAKGTVTGMACPTEYFCYAVTSTGWIEKSTDGGKTYVDSALGIPSAAGVSCLSSTSCVAVGNGIASTTDGTRYAVRTDPNTTNLIALSCAKAFCVALDGSGNIIESTDGVSWQSVTPTTPAGGTLTAVSCPSGTTCFAVGSAATPNSNGGTALIYSTSDGTTWTPVALPGTEGGLTGVSCASATVCDAIGANGLVVRTIDGTDWAPVPASLPHVNLTAITCPSTVMCFVTGPSGRVIHIGASAGH